MALAGLTILGTDTEVGKTYAACRIIEWLTGRGVAVGAYKPVASGATSLVQSDGFMLWKASGMRGTLEQVNPQCFDAPLAPPLAAELEGRRVSEQLIFDGASKWIGQCDFLVVEGAGGLMSPISWSKTNADLAIELQFPIVLVSANRLGVVNQVLSTLQAARSIGLTVSHVILNDGPLSGPLCDEEAQKGNERLLRCFIETRSDRPMLVRLRRDAREFSPQIDWQLKYNDSGFQF